ncbi:MAG TPA: PP2C family protein-serine/threonine phosphatase, partial [bacterium]
AYYFPKERPEILRHRWIRAVPYAGALIFSLYFGLQFLIRNAAMPEQFFPLLTFAGIIYNLLIHFIFRKQRSAEHKRLNRTIAYTIYLVLIAIVLMNPISRVIGLKQINNYLMMPLVLVPFAYLYTIGRYRLLEISWHVRRNIQYTVLSVVWGLLLLFVLLKILLELPGFNFRIPNFRLTLTSFEIVNDPLTSGRRDLLEKFFLMFFAVGLNFLFWKIRQVGQNLIDKKYYRTQLDYRRAASELAEIMATKLNMVDLARGIIQKLAELMQLKLGSVLFFRDDEVCCYQNAYGFDAEEKKDFLIEVDYQLTHALRKLRTDSRFSVDLLPPTIKERLYQQGFRHIIPIWFKEKLEGTLLIGEKLSEAPFHGDDLNFLTAVAKQASVAIENAFLYEALTEQDRMKHELQIARRIQMASLPQSTPKISGLEIAGISIPATEVGGDYFDYLNGVPDSVTVIVGDVSGKGTSAALYLFKIQGILRSLYGFGLSPRELFIRTNKILYRDLDRQSFVTAIGGFFDSKQRQLNLARAGHLPLFYYQSRSNSVQVLAPKGLGLGLDSESIFSAEIEETVLTYQSGDVFLFVSDGITEAQSKTGQEFGEENLVQI